MLDRILGTGKHKRVLKGGFNTEVEIYEVLSSDYRDIEFQGTFEECVTFLNNTCPTGKCEN